MFTRDDVIDFVHAFLQRQAYALEDGTVSAADIVARRNGDRIYVVVTGETTSKKTSREGKAFRPRQVTDHVANAVYKALKLNETKVSGEVVALAFPRNADHEDRVSPITRSLACLSIDLLWVEADGSVGATEG